MSLPRFRSKIPRAATILVVLALWPVATLAAEPPEQVWLTDLDAALAQAREKDALIVVDLYAEWCGWCKKIEREVFPTARFRQFAADKVLLRVDVDDGAEGTALQARHDAFNLPTTLLMDADQVQVGKISGFAPADPLIERFEAEIAAWQRLGERYPQILESGADSLRRSLAQEFHQRGDGERAAKLYAKLLEDDDGQMLDTPWLYYLKADSHRLAGEFADARKASERARSLSQDRGLDEKLDLLAYRIAQDEGDCQGAKSTLQAFLERNPESRMRSQIARRLRALEKGQDGLCA